MRACLWLTTVLTLGACVAYVDPAVAQGTAISAAECQSLRQKLAEHARLSEGVRRAVPAQAGAGPAPGPAAPSKLSLER
jgi:hypothetical protein